MNDTRNLKASLEAVKKYGAHAQLTICYTISDVHTIPFYTDLAKELTVMGADSICIKDMAGILTPKVAKELIPAIKAVIDVPLNIHTHATSGVSQMTYMAAIEAGAQDLEPGEEEGTTTFFTDPTDLDLVSRALPAHGFSVLSAKLGYKPKNPVNPANLSAEQLEEVENFLTAIDGNDDVQNVYVGLAG